MLERICNHVHNFFTRSAHPGTYTITGGALTLDFMKDGQRFHIVGSDLNDGVYTWHPSGIKNDDDDADAELQDETFTGCIMPMAVPKSSSTSAKRSASGSPTTARRSTAPSSLRA